MSIHTAHRILIINHYAGSPRHGMEHRSFQFAREWVKLGHRVLIVAAGYSHLRQTNPQVRRTLTRETIEGVDYLWVRTPQYGGNGVTRAVNMLAFMAHLYGACRRPIAEFGPDLVIASSTYTWDNWPAAGYARKHGARYVYELHDVWPSTPIELSGMSPRHPFIWSLQKAEDFACRHADKVISLLPAAQSHLTEHGMPPDRFAYIPNGIVEEDWAHCEGVPAEHAQAIRRFRQDKRHLVGYVGGHNTFDPLESLVQAAADPSLEGTGVVLVGNGVKKAKLEQLARELRSRTLFLPPVSKRCIPALLKRFDTLYVGFPRSSLYRFGISPNKLYEYMMSGVPVVSAIEAANDPVLEAGCGVSIRPEEVSAIVAAIRRLAALTPQRRRAMGLRGQRYVEQHHRIQALAGHFLDIVWPADARVPSALPGPPAVRPCHATPPARPGYA